MKESPCRARYVTVVTATRIMPAIAAARAPTTFGRPPCDVSYVDRAFPDEPIQRLEQEAAEHDANISIKGEQQRVVTVSISFPNKAEGMVWD